MENKDGIGSIVISLLNKNNKRFVVFSLFLIISLLFFIHMFFGYFYGGLYGGTKILEEYDITGYSEIALVALMIILGAIICISCFYSLRVPKEGVNYHFNRVLGIVFLVLMIFPVLFFDVIRSEEEKIASDYKKQLLEEELNNVNQKSKSRIQKELEELYVEYVVESELSREMEIAKQIRSDESKDEFSKQLIDSFLWDYQSFFWGTERYFRHSDLDIDEFLYYGTYFQMSLISFISGIFYILNSIEPMKNTKEFYNRNN